MLFIFSEDRVIKSYWVYSILIGKWAIDDLWRWNFKRRIWPQNKWVKKQSMAKSWFTWNTKIESWFNQLARLYNNTWWQNKFVSNLKKTKLINWENYVRADRCISRPFRLISHMSAQIRLLSQAVRCDKIEIKFLCWYWDMDFRRRIHANRFTSITGRHVFWRHRLVLGWPRFL